VGTSESLFGVWASSTRVWAVGDHGTIVFSAGDGHWVSVPSGTDAALNAVWAANDEDVFAVGGFGVYLHRTGNGTWTVEPNGGVELIPYGVWGSSPDDVYAVGDRGLLLHRKNGSWQIEDVGVTTSLNGISGRNASEVYIVGDRGLVLRRNGNGTWRSQQVGSQPFASVWAGPRRVVAVGASGVSFVLTENDYALEQTPFATTLFSVSGAGDTVWAAGEKGALIRHGP
jgi:hypothetical protein